LKSISTWIHDNEIDPEELDSYESTYFTALNDIVDIAKVVLKSKDLTVEKMKRVLGGIGSYIDDNNAKPPSAGNINIGPEGKKLWDELVTITKFAEDTIK
jgi:hypothetical protein